MDGGSPILDGIETGEHREVKFVRGLMVAAGLSLPLWCVLLYLIF